MHTHFKKCRGKGDCLNVVVCKRVKIVEEKINTNWMALRDWRGMKSIKEGYVPFTAAKGEASERKLFQYRSVQKGLLTAD